MSFANATGRCNSGALRMQAVTVGNRVYHHYLKLRQISAGYSAVVVIPERHIQNFQISNSVSEDPSSL
jgi:hypothetical protein